MNREIKFRVWDNRYKYMNYKVLVGIYGEWEKVKDDKNYTACCMWIEPDKVNYKCEPHWAHFEPYHKDIHLMQYTGLKDINGKEIYEGDILKVNFDRDKIIDALYAVLNEYQLEQQCFTRKVEMPEIYQLPLSDDIEVIGNIYDNPDLWEC